MTKLTPLNPRWRLGVYVRREMLGILSYQTNVVRTKSRWRLCAVKFQCIVNYFPCLSSQLRFRNAVAWERQHLQLVQNKDVSSGQWSALPGQRVPSAAQQLSTRGKLAYKLVTIQDRCRCLLITAFLIALLQEQDGCWVLRSRRWPWSLP